MELLPLAIGGEKIEKPIIISGPCSAETECQVLETARGLADAGVKLFRAGIWKPRTKPGSFEGVGVPGLEWLKKVREETGMKVATEVATRAHVESALEYGIDILWIGARTTANPFAVQEIADTLSALNPDIPVLVKNPVNPDLELWIGALERLYNAGIRRLAAAHRGFSTYNPGIYRNAPHWRIPLELRNRLPELPLICDPSHIGGRRDLIAPLSQRAIDMGFDGLIIESHCDPGAAWSDMSQQITPSDLKGMLENLKFRDSSNLPEEGLMQMRLNIDDIDNKLLELLAKRMDISRKIGAYKLEHRIPVVQPSRYGNMIRERVAIAESLGIDENFMRRILSEIHEESVRQQVNLSSSTLCQSL